MIPLDDTARTNRFPIWVLMLVAANIYIFFLELTSPSTEEFIYQWALIPNLISFSNPVSLYPFITSQFLHGGILHILSNMWFLWIFGDNVEERSGFLLFPFLYLLSGAIGAFLQYIFMPDSTIPMLGASGAIAGVLGAYFAWFPGHQIKTLIPVFGLPAIINIPAAIMLFYWFATQIFAGGFSFATTDTNLGGVAYFAHIGGFVAGWILAKLISPKKI